MRLLRHLGLIICTLLCFGATSETLKVYTVDYPPFQFISSDNQRTGYSVELLEKAAKIADLEFEYIELPWARAQRVVEQEPNSLIFTLAKTKERLQRFLWIDSIYLVRDGLYALASRKDIHIDSLKDIYQYTLALPTGDASIQKLGMLPDHSELLFIVNSQDIAINMLLLGRADLNHNNEIGFYAAVDKMNLSRDLFKKVYVTNQSEMGIATSKKTDPAIVNRLRDALSQLRQSGVIAQLQQKWFQKEVKQP